MEAEFWHQRWAQGQIGFHEGQVNRYLRAWFPELGLAHGAHVLVPLCGKSLDLLWLWQQGFRVTGLEVSRQACSDFFTENAIPYRTYSETGFEHFVTDGLSLFCGDFFEWRNSAGPIDAVYDRAALIALPPEMRTGYAAHLQSLMPAGSAGLLVTLEYPQDQKAGPPFSVSSDEVEVLLDRCDAIRCLESRDILEEEPRFKARGVTRLTESVFRFRRRPD